MKSEDIIIIDDEIVTNKISYFKFDKSKSTWVVRFKKNSGFYRYQNNRVRIVKGTNDILNYMKDISLVSAQNLVKDNGNNILYSQLEKIKITDLNNALANYFKISSNCVRNEKNDLLIFPFGCNSSQYKAVENAINGKISVVEGPPGTGKTQTILNIIANILIRDMNCQVVSNNNAAIDNISQKLKKYDLDFISALLGNRNNKDFFLENQIEDIPNLSEYKEADIGAISLSLKEKKEIVKNIYDTKNDLAKMIQMKEELTLEYEYFNEYVKKQQIELLEVKFFNLDKLKKLFNEMISLPNLSNWHILKYIYFYGVGNFKFYKNAINLILDSIKNAIYINDLKCLESDIKNKQEYVDYNQKNEDYFIRLSMLYFKCYLSNKYSNQRKKYSGDEIWKNSVQFLSDYPVVLSTTYSSRNTVNNDFKFDYIIMDESSQIDVVTGTLALSSARYAVIIGDEKQLPNVVADDVREKTTNIFANYDLDKGYSYSLNSFLSSVKRIVPNVSITLLREHYRCQPKIINFCNNKFYNNELVIMTKDNGESDVIRVIKTPKGNHTRRKVNQRQLDIIKTIIPNLKSSDIGIIAPYNEQVNLISDNFPSIDVSTVHKFQGREKDIIIISTVDDDISDFVGDPNLLNVAISRAKNQLIFIVTGNEIKNKNIQDFIDYVEYNNMEIVDSKIGSIFDLLYKQNELERLEFFKKNNRILEFDSENLIYYLLKDIVSNYENIDFIFYQPLKELIVDKSLLTEKEMKYVLHPNTHVDFRIYNKLTKKTIMIIEVDGYKYHKKETEQYERDLLKNEVLKKYNIPFIRLATNGSQEKDRITDMLDNILK